MKILLISSTLPWPLEQNGTSQRSGLILEALQRWGRVDVLVAADALYIESPEFREKVVASPGWTIHTLAIPREREVDPWLGWSRRTPGKLRNLLLDIARQKGRFTKDPETFGQLEGLVRAHEYDLVVSRYLGVGCRAGAPFVNGVRQILDFDDVDWQFHQSEMEGSGGGAGKAIRERLLARYQEWIGRKRLTAFDFVWVTCPEDMDHARPRPCAVLPNIPILPENHVIESGGSSERRSILFVGELRYRPNMVGLDRFITQVWPLVRAAQPDIRLEVVGRLPDDDGVVARWRATAGVDVLGFAPSLDAAYQNAHFTIAPVYWGGGTKIKVLESLGRGRTAVVTTHAVHGVSDLLRDGESLLVVRDDVAFADACIRLLGDTELRSRLEAKGQHEVGAYYSRSRFCEIVDQTMSAVFPGHSATASQ